MEFQHLSGLIALAVAPLRKAASRALYFAALIIIANVAGAFNLWNSPLCWAGQTVNVNTGDNLQALVNQYPPSTTFSLAPGIHRLQSVVPKSGDSFVGQTGAVLSGAALLTNFVQNGSYWVSHVQVTQASSYRGLCNSAHPACALPEDLFFDNIPKSRVTSLSAVKPGSWYLDYRTGNVYMADAPWGHTVEISLLPYAFAGDATVVIVSNLVIEKYACVAGNGAIGGGGGTSYWEIEWNNVRYNHGVGIVTGYGMYVHDNKVHHNGQLGIGGVGASALVQSNEISFNNYSGYDFYWEAGGAKFASVQNLTFRCNYSHDNSGPGFWIDVNSQNVLCEWNQFSGNEEAGVLTEISSYITVSNNYFWNEGFNPDGTSLWWGAAILVSNASNVSVYFNTITSSVNGIGGILANRGNAPNGQPYLLQNLAVNNNSITQATGTAVGIVETSQFDNSVYTSWNNQFRNNTFSLTNPAGNYVYWLNQPMSVAGWQAISGF